MDTVKTKFILHGGFSSGKTDEDNHAFYAEALKSCPEEIKILLVPFAKDEDRIPLAVERVSKEFQKVRGMHELSVTVATEKDFIHQIRISDIIYFHGGVSLNLLDVLRQYPNLEAVLQGKVIVGESAGANVWCRFFYSPTADTVSQGLGLLPLKIIPHYREEYAGKLNGADPGLETLLLPEYEYRVFEV